MKINEKKNEEFEVIRKFYDDKNSKEYFLHFVKRNDDGFTINASFFGDVSKDEFKEIVNGLNRLLEEK